MSSKKKNTKKDNSPKKQKVNTPTFKARFQSWWEDRSIPLRFLGVFILLMGGFYLFYFSDFNSTYIHPYILSAQASIGAFLIGLFNSSATSMGEVIQTNDFSMNVSGGCDGMEVTALLISSIIAFPSTWAEKWKGLGVGLAILTVLNVLRLPVLYWAGAKVSQELFDFLHVQGGFILFISISILIWGLWIIRILNERKQKLTTA